MWHPDSIYDANGHLDEGVVHAWLDGELEESTGAELEAHAATCAACSALVAEARGLVAGATRVLSALDEPAGARRELHMGIVGRGGVAGGDSRAGSRTMRRVSLAAAAALVFVAGTVVLQQQAGDGGADGIGAAVRSELAQAPGAVPHSVPLATAASDTVRVASRPEAAASGTAGTMKATPQVTANAETAPRVAGTMAATPRVAGDVAAARALPPVTSPMPGAPPALRSPQPAATKVAEAEFAPRESSSVIADDRRDVARGVAGGVSGGIARSAATEAQAQGFSTAASSRALMESCWRIANTDSVFDLRGARGRRAPRMVPDVGWNEGDLIIRGRGEPLTWIPVADSAVARVRFQAESADDLMLRPQGVTAELGAVARGDAVAATATSRGRALSVSCP